jgi:hypothetical protein
MKAKREESKRLKVIQVPFEPRPATCIETGAHWSIDGKCFFCGEELEVEHHDDVRVKKAS